VLAKGLGFIETAWCVVKADGRGSNASTASDCSSDHDVSHASPDMDDDLFADKQPTLVNWHTESLAQYLKVVVAQQKENRKTSANDKMLGAAEQAILDNKRPPIEEITDKLTFPAVDNLEKIQAEAHSVELGDNIMTQLRSFVRSIAALYKDVPFHNFERMYTCCCTVMLKSV
jgi:hypothetical protein